MLRMQSSIGIKRWEGNNIQLLHTSLFGVSRQRQSHYKGRIEAPARTSVPTVEINALNGENMIQKHKTLQWRSNAI
jgi:hypothetical protein